MSREIKFRAWGENIKEYMSQSFDGEVEIANVTRILGDLIDQGNWVIEQYTGLKDKNGKEIYEGDIIQEEIDYGDKNIDGVYRYSVYWNDDFLSWSLEGLSPDTFHTELYETNMSREIIGNIHEHPELVRDGEL